MDNTKVRIQKRRQKNRQRKQLTLLAIGGTLLILTGTFIGISAWGNRADKSLIKVTDQPSLEVDQELIDFGDVKLNSHRTFSVNLTNVGDQTLIISETPYVEVKEGC